MIDSSSKILITRSLELALLIMILITFLIPQLIKHFSIAKLPTMTGNGTKVNNPLMQAPIVINKIGSKTHMAKILTRFPSSCGETNSWCQVTKKSMQFLPIINVKKIAVPSCWRMQWRHKSRIQCFTEVTKTFTFNMNKRQLIHNILARAFL